MAGNLTGTRLGKYEIHAEIGRGGMGAVYRAYDRPLDRWVAMKVLAPHLAWEEQFVERFLREARAAAQLRHPNVVTIHDVGQEEGWYYFVMEYLEGRALTEVIRQRGPMAPGEALGILRPLAAALDYAHRRGLVHRDVKPANVIVEPGGQVTLTDFGIARAAEGTRLTETGALIGTPEYMSPEQARGGEVGPRSDQYALGVVAYEMLTGQVPFQAGSTPALLHKVVYEPPPPLREARPDLSAQVGQVLEQALAKEAEERYGSCGEFVSALGQALHAPQPAAAQPEARPAAPPARSRTGLPAPPRAQRGRQRTPGWIWAAGAALILVVVAVVALLARRGPGEDREEDAVSALATQLTAGAQTAAAEVPPTRPADTPLPPTSEPAPTEEVPPTETASPTATAAPSLAAREVDLLRGLRYRRGNGDVIFVYVLQTPPAIDGRLDEWGGRVYDVLYEVHDPEDSRSGSSDLYGRFYTGWDVDHLYLGVEVTDDVHVQIQSGKLLYEGDDVEIQIDADLAGDFNDLSLSGDDGQVGLSAGDFSARPPEAYIWLPAGREQTGTMISVAAQQIGGGYTLEAAIPWWTLGGRPPVETAVGFCLGLADNDTPGVAQQRAMVSTAPGRKWGDPTTWGTLVLVDWR